LAEAWEKTILLLRVCYYGSIVFDGGGSGEESSGRGGDDAIIVGEELSTTLNSTHRCQQCTRLDTWTRGAYPMYTFTDSLPSLSPPAISPTKYVATLVQGYQEEDEPTKLQATTSLTTAFTTSTTTTTNTEQQQHQLNLSQPFLLVHAATKVDCPRLVVKIATKLYPDQLHKTDSNGYTPLALAACSTIFKEHDLSDEGYCIEDQIHGDDVPPISFSYDDLSSNNERRQQQQQSYQTSSPSVIQILLDASMEVASHPHPHTGRIPLHYAILSGKTWFEGVHTILEAYPNGIMAVDSVTGLYPFMLAATVGTSRNEKLRATTTTITTMERDAMLSGDGDGGGGMMEQADSTTIFCLLRRKPESLLWSSTM